MKHVLNIVATCTNLKTAAPVPWLRLRQVGRGHVEERTHEWRERLERPMSCEKLREARDLYKGGYWTNVKRLALEARGAGYDARLWIASAGHGLVAEHTRIAPYGATFAGRQPDSVPRPFEDVSLTNRLWWKELTKPRKNDCRSLRSLTELALETPSASLLFFGSPHYVNAALDDLRDARQAIKHHERLVIITSSTNIRVPALTDSLVENDARLSHALGGALVLMHARAAQFVLQVASGRPLDAAVARRKLRALMARQPPLARPARKFITDEGVRAYIARHLASEPDFKPTPLLLKLRKDGWMCEQKRFKALYQHVARGAS